MAWFTSKADKARALDAEATARRQQEKEYYDGLQAKAVEELEASMAERAEARKAESAERAKAQEVEARARLNKMYEAILAGGTFSGPCAAAEGIEAILGSVDTDNNAQFKTLYDKFTATVREGGDPTSPPLVAAIQMVEFESLPDRARFVLRAGNRVETYWRYEVSMTGSSTMTGKVVISDAQTDPRLMWIGNLQQFGFMIERTMASIGGAADLSR